MIIGYLWVMTVYRFWNMHMLLKRSSSFKGVLNAIIITDLNPNSTDQKHYNLSPESLTTRPKSSKMLFQKLSDFVGQGTAGPITLIIQAVILTFINIQTLLLIYHSKIVPNCSFYKRKLFELLQNLDF